VEGEGSITRACADSRVRRAPSQVVHIHTLLERHPGHAELKFLRFCATVQLTWRKSYVDCQSCGARSNRQAHQGGGEAVLASMGLTVSEAFRMMMVRIAAEKALGRLNR